MNKRVARYPRPVSGFSRAEVEAAQELRAVAEDLRAPEEVWVWLDAIARAQPKDGGGDE